MTNVNMRGERKPDSLLSLQDAAERLNCSIKTVRRIVKRGELPANLVGRQIRIEPRDVEFYLIRNKMPQKLE